MAEESWNPWPKTDPAGRESKGPLDVGGVLVRPGPSADPTS
jgi:hypothetical protein